MEDDEFEWSDEKVELNRQRHGVPFEAARAAFGDVFAVGREDTRVAYGEQRFVPIGMAGSRLLHVAYTYRNERIRIISARAAEPREHRWYHEENSED